MTLKSSSNTWVELTLLSIRAAVTNGFGCIGITTNTLGWTGSCSARERLVAAVVYGRPPTKIA